MTKEGSVTNEIKKRYNLKDTTPSSLEQGLRRAAVRNNVEDILFLVNTKHVNVNAQDHNENSKKTALHWAVKENATESVATLLNLGAKTDNEQKNNNHVTFGST